MKPPKSLKSRAKRMRSRCRDFGGNSRAVAAVSQTFLRRASSDELEFVLPPLHTHLPPFVRM